MEFYRVESGSMAHGEFSYEAGDIVEITPKEVKNAHFDTMNNLMKRAWGDCDKYLKNSGGKPYCGKYRTPKHPYCVKDPSTF